MKPVFFILVLVMVLSLSCRDNGNDQLIMVGEGQMPQGIFDEAEVLHVVYGKGDSLLHAVRTMQSRNVYRHDVIGILPDLAASHMRGPQVAVTTEGIAVIACTDAGDIHSFYKKNGEEWKRGNRLNDRDTVAKEGLLSLAGSGNQLFAVWLDLRSGNNQLYGSSSYDGGKNWSSNELIYASPDTAVCECCKPSVIMKDNKIAIQFRNQINGFRDMYVIQSNDGGRTFTDATKLGIGSWKLEGCPMDGGALAFSAQSIQTVWRRESNLYTCEPGKTEIKLATGRNPSTAITNGKQHYAWSEDGNIMILPNNGKIQRMGKGNSPQLVAKASRLFCIWENNKQILAAEIQ
jgi:hypothetical protein